MIELLKFDNYQKMPWKNGLGFTFEIARSPQNDREDFVWRVSMAEVENDSEFSFFKDKQRVISVLSGQGVNLTLDQSDSVDVLSRELFAFNGEKSVFCRLLDGPIRDLNLIFNTDIKPRMQWVKGHHPETIVSSAHQILIFNMADIATVEINSNRYVLTPLDCLKIENTSEMMSINLKDNMPKDCCLIEFF